MNELIGRVFAFETKVYPEGSELYGKLAREGQSPGALMISCADSRIVPEQVMQAGPGELFVCRNAGNMVPPVSDTIGGVSATVEYAVAVLGVREIIVCGHSDCGAMKGLSGPADALAGMPAVAAWLAHGAAAKAVVEKSYPELDGAERLHALSLENVAAQLTHLRTHPSVAAAIARGEMALHGWFVDIHDGRVLALNGESGRFEPIEEGKPLPVALPSAARRAAAAAPLAEAAE